MITSIYPIYSCPLRFVRPKGAQLCIYSHRLQQRLLRIDATAPLKGGPIAYRCRLSYNRTNRRSLVVRKFSVIAKPPKPLQCKSKPLLTSRVENVSIIWIFYWFRRLGKRFIARDDDVRGVLTHENIWRAVSKIGPKAVVDVKYICPKAALPPALDAWSIRFCVSL